MLRYAFKTPGKIMTALGLVLAVCWSMLDFRFEFPVLAIVSSYLETQYFAIFKTNFADETILLLLLGGLSLWVFSEEREEREEYMQLRYTALRRSIIAFIVFNLLSILFVYGSIYISILLLNLFLPFIIYLILFYLALRKWKSAHLS